MCLLVKQFQIVPDFFFIIILKMVSCSWRLIDCLELVVTLLGQPNLFISMKRHNKRRGKVLVFATWKFFFHWDDDMLLIFKFCSCSLSMNLRN
jgi:hypothetical protein